MQKLVEPENVKFIVRLHKVALSHVPDQMSTAASLYLQLGDRALDLGLIDVARLAYESAGRAAYHFAGKKAEADDHFRKANELKTMTDPTDQLPKDLKDSINRLIKDLKQTLREK